MQLEQLNKNHGIPSQLSIVEGVGEKSGFPFIHISNHYADAVISIYGGQVLSFEVKDEVRSGSHEVFFSSEKAFYQLGKAIKGGVPICWPWFGDDPESQGRAAHGFARTSLWSVEKTTALANGETQVILALMDNPETQSIWPDSFKLTLTVTVGKTLRLALRTHNTGKVPFTITQALHSYFLVGDINQSCVMGLEGKKYIDKTSESLAPIKQHATVVINEEVDRIYLNTPAETRLIDKTLKRGVNIVSQGSKSTVVWNPWVESTAQMEDLQDDDYQQFLCVETANVTPDEVEVPAGGSACLGVQIAID